MVDVTDILPVVVWRRCDAAHASLTSVGREKTRRKTERMIDSILVVIILQRHHIGECEVEFIHDIIICSIVVENSRVVSTK